MVMIGRTIACNTSSVHLWRCRFIATGIEGVRRFQDTEAGATTVVVAVGDVFFNPAGAVNINADITTNGGTFTTTGADLNIAGTVSTLGGLVSSTHLSSITIDGIINSAGGAIGMQTTGVGSTLNLNGDVSSGIGPVSLDALGTLNLGAASSVTTSSGLVNIGSLLAGVVNLGGQLVTVDGDVTLENPLTLAHDFLIDTSAGGGNITLTGTINGNSILTLDAGALGLIDLQAEIINFHVATKTVPSLTRRVEISAFGHDDL